MSLTEARMERDEFALMRLIKTCSRFRACRATDKTLAAKMEWKHPRKVQRVLRRLVTHRYIQVVPTEARLREGRWARERTIYIVSRVDREKGALLVANLARARGKTNRFSDEAACGQLQCTHSQFSEWLQAACAAKYIKVWQEGERRVIERIGKFPAVDLPNRFCEDKWKGPPACPDLQAKILELVAGKRKVTAFGTTFNLPTTDAELAKCISGSRSYAQELTKSLITEGKLHSWEKDGRRYLSTTPPPPGTELKARLAVNRKVEAILKLLDEGPRTTVEVGWALQLQRIPPYTMRKMRSAGVKVTRFGNGRVLSRGPLPAGYVDEVRHRQRREKAQRDAERRRLARLGIDRDEARLIDNAIGELQDRFWDRYGRALLRGEDAQVAAWAREFQAFVTFERALIVFKEMKTAGQPLDATNLAVQCVHKYVDAWSASRPREAA